MVFFYQLAEKTCLKVPTQTCSATKKNYKWNVNYLMSINKHIRPRDFNS